MKSLYFAGSLVGRRDGSGLASGGDGREVTAESFRLGGGCVEEFSSGGCEVGEDGAMVSGCSELEGDVGRGDVST